HAHARQADVREKPALVGIDLVYGHKLLGLPSASLGIRLIVLDDQLYRASVDTSRRIDPAHGEFRADQGHAPRGLRYASQRLDGPELVRSSLAKGFAPRRGHEHPGPNRAGGSAQTENAPAGDLALVPEVLGPRLILPADCDVRLFMPSPQ